MDAGVISGGAEGAAVVESSPLDVTPEAHRAPKGPDGKFRQVQDVADRTNVEASQGGGGETQQEAAARRKLALKVYGEEHALELDDGTAQSLAKVLGVDPDKLGEALQKSAAGSRALSEAAKERRAIAQERAEMEKRFERLRQSPDDVLAELGVDPDELALRRLQAAAQRESMTPEQLAMAEREQALSAREAKLQQMEQARQAEAAKVAEQQAFEHAQQTLIPALEASGLPKNHATLALMADVALDALDAGVELTPEQVAQETRALVMERTQSVLRGMQPAQLVQVLGKDLVRALMQHTVEQSRSAARPPPSPRHAQQVESAEDDGPAFLTPAQALRGL